jgi:hypothetical protein
MSGTGGNKMFAQWWGDVKVQSVIFVQRLPTRTVAASKAHHCANTNVGRHLLMDTVDNEIYNNLSFRTSF